MRPQASIVEHKNTKNTTKEPTPTTPDTHAHQSTARNRAEQLEPTTSTARHKQPLANDDAHARTTNTSSPQVETN